jgi:hypothetical protein
LTTCILMGGMKRTEPHPAREAEKAELRRLRDTLRQDDTPAARAIARLLEAALDTADRVQGNAGGGHGR